MVTNQKQEKKPMVPGNNKDKEKKKKKKLVIINIVATDIAPIPICSSDIHKKR